MRGPLILRGLVLALLAAALVPATRVGPGEAPWSDAEALQPVLSGVRVPGLIVRESLEPPTAAELEALAAAARVTPLAVVLPEALPRLRIEPLADLRAGRAAALAFTIRGIPGDTVPVRLLDETGIVDSTAVPIGARGEASAAFRIRPEREGWREWRVEAGASAVAGDAGGGRRRINGAPVTGWAGSWVRAASPPRVLLASGPPSIEGRFIARALEEAGAEVTTAIALGRGMRVGPRAAARLAGYDVVILLSGGEVVAGRVAEALDFVTARGGGVLDAGSGAALRALGLGAGWSEGDEARGEEIAWRLPAGLGGLPAVPVRGMAQRVVREGAGIGVETGVGVEAAGPLLVLGAAGRGRVAALGLRESWRWRLEAGQVEGHREFWRDLVDWLAGGLRDSVILRLDAAGAVSGAPVEILVHAAGVEGGAEAGTAPGMDGAGAGRAGSAAAPPDLVLTRPDGRTEPLVLGAVPEADAVPGGPGSLRATVMPESDGIYLIATGGSTRLAFRAGGASGGAASAGSPAWPRLAFVAERSGGAAVPEAELEGWLEGWRREHGVGGRWRGWAGPLLFALIVAAALAEWSLRRLRGEP
jgi:hypothetical protein